MKILFLAANPDGTSSLQLDEEVRRIEDSLRKSRLRDQFQFETKWAVTATDLRQALLEKDPDIVHFSGHGEGQAGLVLVGQNGEPRPATADALSALFKLFPKVQCVVLNACYAEEQAKAIVQHVDYVVGMKQAIKDDAAIAFSTGFYDGLGYGKPVQTAFELGCVAIQFEMASFTSTSRKLIPVGFEDAQQTLQVPADHQIPVLLKRENLPEEPISAIKFVSVQPEHLPEKLQSSEVINTADVEQQYRQRLQEFLKDGHLTNIEAFQLATLANVLKISQDKANGMLEEEQNRINLERSQPSRSSFKQIQNDTSKNSQTKPIQKKRWPLKLIGGLVGGGVALFVLAVIFTPSHEENPPTDGSSTAVTAPASEPHPAEENPPAEGSSTEVITSAPESQSLVLSDPNITIVYFPQQDASEVEAALSPFGGAVQSGAAEQTQAAKTNVIGYGSQVKPEDVKAVAVTLIRRGIPIQSIEPLDHSYPPLEILIGARTVPENTGVWTEEQLQKEWSPQ